MKPIINAFVVDIDEDYSKYVRKADGSILYGADGNPVLDVSHEFNYASNRNRIATIVEIPFKLLHPYQSYSLLNKGDKVLLHKEAFSPANKIEDTDLWKLEPVHIIAKVNGEELIPLGDRVFLDKIENTETKVGSIFLPFATTHIEQQGVVRWVSDDAYDWGIRSGHTAFMYKDAKADITFNGNTYYTVDKEMLFGQKDGDDLKPYGYYVTVKPHEEKEGLIFVPMRRRDNTMRGDLIRAGRATKQVKKGNEVFFFRLSHQSYGDLLVMREDYVVGIVTA